MERKNGKMLRRPGKPQVTESAVCFETDGFSAVVPRLNDTRAALLF